MKTLRLALPLLLLLGLTAPTSLAATGGLSRIPNGGPVAGPIEVFANAAVVSLPLGLLVDSDLAVENHGAEPLQVLLLVQVDWPDGSSQRLRLGRPFGVDAGGAVLFFATSLVPDGVGSGPATLTATAFVTRVSGGRAGLGGGLIAQDAAPFTLP